MAILGLIRRIMGASNDVGLCYNAMVAQARQPHFYAQLGVPDTFDGRFECIVLHLAILHAAMAEPVERHAQRQALVEHFVSDMDNQMREIGVSDSGISKKMTKTAEHLYGRFKSYQSSIATGDVTTLAENLSAFLSISMPEHAERIAQYVLVAAAQFESANKANAMSHFSQWPEMKEF